VLVGLTGMTLDREPFYKRELDLRLSMSYGPGRYDPAYEQGGHDYPLPYVRWTEQRNMQAFLEQIAAGRVTPSKLVTHIFAIADAEKAYGVLDSDEPYLAILLTYPEAPATPPNRVVHIAPSAPRQGGVGLGFIGIGAYARSVLVPAARTAGARFTIAAAATGLSAVNGAEKFGFEAAATDPDAVFAHVETDAVAIATRHATHADLAIRALNAGKHVFCEKPLALTRADVDSVVTTAQASGRVLTVGFNRRFAPMMIAIKDALAGRSAPLVMSYRVNAGSAPADSWLKTDEGGGRILGEACHFVDALTFLAGAEPVSVHAVGADRHADAVTAILSFADGSIGTIIYSSLGDPSVPKEYLEVFTEGRVARMEDFRTLSLTRNGKTVKTTAGTQDKGQAAMMAAFLGAVQGTNPPPIPLSDIVAVSHATIAIEAALRGEPQPTGASA
jgi:predicted dehydrogenase